MGDARHVSGTLSGAGVTDAREARLAEGGLIAVQGPGLLDALTGVAYGPGSTTLITGTTATGPMTVQIGAHHAITTRGSANGVYLGPVLEAAQTVNIDAAPASGSRIDVVYVKQQDGGSGIPSPDTTTAPLYGVVTGTASSSPTKPALTVVGAEELGTVQVAAGATSTNGSGVTITNTARQTVARGAPIPVRTQAERDALTTYPLLCVLRLDTGNLEVRNPGDTGWNVVRYAAGPTTVAFPGGPNYAAVSGYVAPKLMTDVGGWVTGSSAIIDTAGGTNRLLGTLPVGSRPLNGVQPLAIGGGPDTTYNLYRVDVGTDGTCTVLGTIPANTYFYLDTFRFNINN